MTGSSVLDVAIGMMFIYLLFGVLCTAFNEMLASLTNKRGRNLMDGIQNLLNDPDYTGLAHQIYNHGLIDGISQNATSTNRPNRLPSYIPSNSFSLALVDILTTRGALATAHCPLLDTAEKCDDDYDAAVRAAGKQPNPAQQQTIAQAAQAQKSAEQALIDAIQQATKNEEEKREARDQTPHNAQPTEQWRAAARQLELAKAALKMLYERRAAIASAKTPKDAQRIQLSANATEAVMALGRAIAKGETDPLLTIENAIAQLPNGHTKETLAVLLDKTRRELCTGEHALETLRKNLENWFNQSMERVSGWYKRWSQKISLSFACFLVVLCNIDTLQIAQRLMNDSALRASLVRAATVVAQRANDEARGDNANTAANDAANPPLTLSNDVSREIVNMAAQNPNLPFGWDFSRWTSNKNAAEEATKKTAGGNTVHNQPSDWQLTLHWIVLVLGKLIGLGISIFAISLGAPFWFDLLIKFINVRSGGKPPSQPVHAASK